jgi:hypothetical protein
MFMLDCSQWHPLYAAANTFLEGVTFFKKREQWLLVVGAGGAAYLRRGRAPVVGWPRDAILYPASWCWEGIGIQDTSSGHHAEVRPSASEQRVDVSYDATH